MLTPKRVKFRKQHRGRLKGTSGAKNIIFGDYGLQALEPAWITSKQIESTRRSITRYVRNVGNLWIRIFPDKPITRRAAESRMGSGKGAVAFWVATVKSGTILFELNGLEKQMAHRVLKLASYKLPLKTAIVNKSY